MSRPTRPSLALLLLAGGCAALAPAPPPEQDASLRLSSGLAALEDGRHVEAFEELAWVYAHCPGREAGAQARAAMAALELDPNNRGGRPAVGMELLGDLILDPGTPDWLRPLVRTTYTLGLGLGAPPAATGEPQLPADTLPGEPADTIRDPVIAILRADTTRRQPPDTIPAPDPDVVPEPTRADTAPAPEDPRRLEVDRPVDRVATEAGPVHGCGPFVDPVGPIDVALPTLPGPSLAVMLQEAEAELAAREGRAGALQDELAAARRELAETRAELDRIRRTLRP